MGACSSSPAVAPPPPSSSSGASPAATAALSSSDDEKKKTDDDAAAAAAAAAATDVLAESTERNTTINATSNTGNNSNPAAASPGANPQLLTPDSQVTSTTNSTTPASDRHYPLTSRDVSIGSNLSTDSTGSSHSSNGGRNNNYAYSNHNNNNNNNNNINSGRSNNNNTNHEGKSIDLSTSHRRRKSRQLTHSDSKVGLNEIICGDLKNPNLVRIEVPLGKPIEEVYEGVHDGPVLGSGISGIVRLVKHRATQVAYAVKCLDLALIDSEEGLKQLKEEIYIMCQLDHPNIVRLEEVYESHSEIYLVQEVCKGGELFDRLDEQPDYHYTEAQCARLVKEMLSSVRYIHNKGIIHRDLKLENFLFSEMDSGSELKMIDFGLSKHFTFGEVHHEAVGTPYTVAPEVIRGSYDERCDVWAIGVITYLCLSGEPPFGGCGGPETLLQVRDNILKGEFKFEPADIWETVSPEAKEFIRSLLVIDPMDRPTARQAKESKWLKMWSSRDKRSESDRAINPNVVKALISFKELSDMRKLLCEVLSFTLLPEQIQGLRKEFEKYDQEGTGEITLSTLKKVLIGNASTGSLGGLTEEEVVDIFNAMRVRKGETSIHWHDFIAAGLSQCQVDDRNLRLAFERLDPENNGYITFENVMDLMGDDTFEDEDQMLQMWGDILDANCKSSLINFEDFVLLMKGQKRDPTGGPSAAGGAGARGFSLRASLTGLSAVPEMLEDDEEHEDYHHPPIVVGGTGLGDDSVVKLHTPLGSFNEKDSPVTPSELVDNAAGTALAAAASKVEIVGMPFPVPVSQVRKPTLSPKEVSTVDFSSTCASPGRMKNLANAGSNSAPATPLHFGKRFDEVDQGAADSPFSMDADENPGPGSRHTISFNEQCDVFTMPSLDLTPPQTPVRGPADYVTPTVARHTLDPQLISHLSPPDLSLPGTLPSMPGSSDTFTPSTFTPTSFTPSPTLPSSLGTRGRSISLDEEDTYSSKAEAESRRSMMFKRDSRRAMAIPEHTHNVSDINRAIEDKTKTPLVVNRKLYRAHREFRHTVTEACKRFEDEQMRRAKETLRAQESVNAKHTAGLVMRHGQTLSEQSIKGFLKKTLEEQQKQTDQASRKGGRGRRSRKKTVSDMSGMLAASNNASPGGTGAGNANNENNDAPMAAARKTIEGAIETPTTAGAMGAAGGPKKEALAPVKENENLLRNPTKPGEFRKTNYDPFQRKSRLSLDHGGIGAGGGVGMGVGGIGMVGHRNTVDAAVGASSSEFRAKIAMFDKSSSSNNDENSSTDGGISVSGHSERSLARSMPSNSTPPPPLA